MMRNSWKALVVAIALAGLAGGSCGKAADKAATAADTTARDLTLLPNQSSPALNDVPAPGATEAYAPPPAAAPAAVEPAAPAPRRTAPAPRRRTAPPARRTAPAPKAEPAPRPAAPSTFTAASGTHLSLAVTDTISSRSAKAGEEFTARVRSDVTDAAGHVVIPAGSIVKGSILEIKPGGARDSGTLKLDISSVSVHGQSYPLAASVQSLATTRQGRGITGKEAAKVGVGTAVGAVAGRLLGKNTRGTVIGGAVGAAAGAGVAAATRSVDIVLPAGGEVNVTLTSPVTVPAH